MVVFVSQKHGNIRERTLQLISGSCIHKDEEEDNKMLLKDTGWYNFKSYCISPLSQNIRGINALQN